MSERERVSEIRERERGGGRRKRERVREREVGDNNDVFIDT